MVTKYGKPSSPFVMSQRRVPACTHVSKGFFSRCFQNGGKDLANLEEKQKHLQDRHSSLLSVFGKLSEVLVNHARRRGKHSLVKNQEAKEFDSHMGDDLLQTLQKCLFEESCEIEQLSAKLEKGSNDLKELKSEMKQKLEDTKSDYVTKLENLKKNHQEALESVKSQCTKETEKLRSSEQQLDLTNKNHSIELSSLMEKVNTLKKELDNVNKQKDDIVSEFEKKSSEFDFTNHGSAVELKLLREEKEKLLSTLSQEQANVITLKNTLVNTEENLKIAQQRINVLSEENSQSESNLRKEIENYRLEAEKYKSLLIEREQGLCFEMKKEVQNAIRDEQSKADGKIDIVLIELKKVNSEALTLKDKCESLETELNELKVELKVTKETLEKTEKHLTNEKDERLKTMNKLENEMNEGNRLRKQLDAKAQDLEERSKEIQDANINFEKLKTQLEQREKTIATFREQDNYFAEIVRRNSQAGDTLQREKERLVKKEQERSAEVQEMKKHCEILATKLIAKDKRLKEIEVENDQAKKSMAAKSEELAALRDDRNQIVSELNTRQQEVGKLKQERDSLNALLEGKDGEREKEIAKLLSRLKGSEQDLCLTKKLLKSKGDVSGKAVRVAETMQHQVTEKRGEMDALLNKIHWLQENLNTAVKDKMYFESKSSRVSDELQQAILLRDTFQFELKQKIEECNAYQKQVSHLEQALEKAALKYANSQSIIEKLEQDCARLKLKHSLELKDFEKKCSTIKVDSQTIADIMARIRDMNTRFPSVTNKTGLNNTSANQKASLIHQPITLHSLKGSPQSKTLQDSKQDVKNNEVQQDIKSLLLDVRTLISTFQTTLTPVTKTAKYLDVQKIHDVESSEIASDDHSPWLDINGQSNDKEFDISLDIEDGCYGNIRAPLRSSSPNPDRDVSMTTSRDPSTSNDSHVMSLLSFSTAPSLDDGIALIKRDSASDMKKMSLKHSSQNKENLTRKSKKSITSKSPPSYEKAEKMLRSLAQTGTRLTKKNNEISRLLNEQERRIQLCRENEFDLNSLLH